ncbi:MAG: response regulator [Thiotrichales bacterium]
MKITPPVSVILIDDHPVLRLALAEMIKSQDGLTLCAETGSTREGIEAISQLQPDIVIVDIRLDDGSGFDVLQAEFSQRPKFLVFSALKDPVVIRRALNLGASGYITKSSLVTEVLNGIEALVKGETYLGEGVSIEAGNADQNPINSLTNRELEIYELTGLGLGTSDIAKRLGLSVKTVETHKENIKVKLELSSGNELLRHAMQWSLGVNNPGAK